MVEVYYNLHKKKYSIRDKASSLVAAHADQVILTDAILREGKGMKCPYCKEETDALYNNPFIVVDIRTGEQKKDVMCKECLAFTLQEMSPYGIDCRDGKCE